jgi:hypothetical protein
VAEDRQPADTVPYLRVVRGDPSPEELAALVAVLMAAGPAGSGPADQAQPRPVPSRWNSPARLLRVPVHPAAGGWRRSALP